MIEFDGCLINLGLKLVTHVYQYALYCQYLYGEIDI